MVMKKDVVIRRYHRTRAVIGEKKRKRKSKSKNGNHRFVEVCFRNGFRIEKRQQQKSRGKTI